MRINADFTRPASVTPDQYQWVASPQGGVERVMLDRLGAEQARATSLVRYAPHSQFPRHPHPGGEEILVLSGTFSDDEAHYPAGWYLRNPPGSSHQPSSAPGALIFVKLRQMREDETRRVRIHTCDPSAWRREHGRDICPLYANAWEQVRLERLAPHGLLKQGQPGGTELLVLAGSVTLQSRSHTLGSWVRLPAGAPPEIAAGPEGATVYLKTGHLAHLTAPATATAAAP